MSLTYDFSNMRVYGRISIDGYGSTTSGDDGLTAIAFTTSAPVNWELSPESTYMLLSDADCRIGLLDGYHLYDINGVEVAPGGGSIGGSVGAGESPVNASRGMTLLADVYFPITTTRKATSLSVIGKTASGNLEVTRMESKSKGF